MGAQGPKVCRPGPVLISSLVKGTGCASRLFAAMPSPPEEQQHQEEQQTQDESQELVERQFAKRQTDDQQLQETAEETSVFVSDPATSSPRRKLRSINSGLLVEALKEEEITTLRRKTQKVNWGPVHVVVLDSEEAHVQHELQCDLAGNVSSPAQEEKNTPRSPPAPRTLKSPPAPPPMYTSPSPPRCEQHMHALINVARRKARVR